MILSLNVCETLDNMTACLNRFFNRQFGGEEWTVQVNGSTGWKDLYFVVDTEEMTLTISVAPSGEELMSMDELIERVSSEMMEEEQ